MKAKKAVKKPKRLETEASKKNAKQMMKDAK